MDPKAESFAPHTVYNYVLNNPITGVDPTGAEVEFLNDDYVNTLTIEMFGPKTAAEAALDNECGCWGDRQPFIGASSSNSFPPQGTTGTFYEDEDGIFTRDDVHSAWSWHSHTMKYKGLVIPELTVTPTRSNTKSGIGSLNLSASDLSSIANGYGLHKAGVSYLAYGGLSVIHNSSKAMKNILGGVKTIGVMSSFISYYNSQRTLPHKVLLAGDVTMSFATVTSPIGFLAILSWEAGKAAGRYENYLERKRSLGGLDGLITSPY